MHLTRGIAVSASWWPGREPAASLELASTSGTKQCGQKAWKPQGWAAKTQTECRVTLRLFPTAESMTGCEKQVPPWWGPLLQTQTPLHRAGVANTQPLSLSEDAQFLRYTGRNVHVFKLHETS